jgi:hypothetical protein
MIKLEEAISVMPSFGICGQFQITNHQDSESENRPEVIPFDYQRRILHALNQLTVVGWRIKEYQLEWDGESEPHQLLQKPILVHP